MNDSASHPSSFRSRVIVGGLGALFALVGLGFAVGSIVDWRRATALVEHGSTQIAAVISKQVVIDEGKHFYLRYTFEAPNGVRHEKRRRVPRRFWRSVVVGDSQPVRYDPENPSDSRLVAEGPPSIGFTLAMTLFSMAFAAFGGILTIASISAEPAADLPVPVRTRRPVTRS